MIIKCLTCAQYYDDEFRDTGCPHVTFPANDGHNNFKHYMQSWLSDHAPVAGTAEYRVYREWLFKNKVRL